VGNPAKGENAQKSDIKPAKLDFWKKAAGVREKNGGNGRVFKGGVTMGISAQKIPQKKVVKEI